MLPRQTDATSNRRVFTHILAMFSQTDSLQCNLFHQLCSHFYRCDFQIHYSYHFLVHWLLGYCQQVNVTGPHWSQVYIDSGNSLVPSGSKSLPEPMLNRFYVSKLMLNLPDISSPFDELDGLKSLIHITNGEEVTEIHHGVPRVLVRILEPNKVSHDPTSHHAESVTPRQRGLSRGGITSGLWFFICSCHFLRLKRITIITGFIHSMPWDVWQGI